MSDADFIDLVCEAYKELRGLPADTEVEYKIGAYANGTLQITLKDLRPDR